MSQMWRNLFLCSIVIFIVFLLPLKGYAQEEYTIILQRTYMSGDGCEEILSHQHMKPADIMKQYHDWTLVYQDDEEYVFLKKVNDLSPFVKANGFFGITEDGFFHMYGQSSKHKKVIQSFFHVDTKRMETMKREQYKKGVRIHSKHQYFQVIHEMEHYRK